jgi:uncharacterized membrane protein
MDILQLLVIFTAPAIILWSERKIPVFKWLGSVIICYIFGGILGNQSFWLMNPKVSNSLIEAAVPLSIPLLLFSTDFVRWLRLARSTVLSFILIIISVLVVTSVGAFLFKDDIDEYWKVAGMLVGVYTGGTPNMSAIGLALGVKEEVFLLINTADMVLGGVYFFFALSFMQRFLGKFLRPFKSSGETAQCLLNVSSSDFTVKKMMKYIGMVLFSGVILGVSAGLSLLFYDKLNAGFIILMISTVGIACSFSERIRTIECSYDIGQYLLLVFCVGIGSLAKIEHIANASMVYFAYTAFVLVFSLSLHFLLCWIFKIDRDTALITSIAGIFGPAFVGPVASSMKNKEIVVSGLTSGLVGIALGNYLGILLAKVLAHAF